MTTTLSVSPAGKTAAVPVVPLIVGFKMFVLMARTVGAVGAVVSMLGVAWVLIRGDVLNAARISFVPGDLFMLLAIALWALYTWLLRSRPAEMSGYSVLTMQMAWGLLFAVPMVLAELFWGNYAAIEWSPKIYGMVVYVALGPALLAYLCYQQAVLRTGSQLPMFFLNLTPVFAALMSVMLLGEFPELYHVVGLVLIVLGIVLANPPKKSV